MSKRYLVPGHVWLVWIICVIGTVGELLAVQHELKALAACILIVHGFALWLLMCAVTSIMERQRRTLGMAL